MVDIICALCGQKQQTKVLYEATFKKRDFTEKKYSARRLPDKIHYRLLKCERCGLIFSSPVFSQQYLAKFYRKSKCTYREQIPYLIRTYTALIEKIIKHLPRNPKILEIGCGNGFLLKSLVDMGITTKAYGIEPSRKMVESSDFQYKKNIKISVFKQNLYPSNSFDLILCFHTLDHMFDPKEFVKGSYSMLKPGGYIIVVVHDTQGLSVKLFGESSAIFDIEHIFLFNKKNLREIFSKNKFEIVDLFDLVNTYPLGYWIKMSGLPSLIKKLFHLITFVFNMKKRPVSFAAGNIGLIARKP